MARLLRLEFPGALYHVTSRGNQRGNIFDDNDDRRQFLLVLQEVFHRYNWICHAYCLMSNHYRLLIEKWTFYQVWCVAFRLRPAFAPDGQLRHP
jgi:putative transposase